MLLAQYGFVSNSYGLTESSAAFAALSNSPSSHSLVPRNPATTSRAQATYSSRRFTDHWGEGLAVIARRLLVLSASLISFAREDLLGAVSTCLCLRVAFELLVVGHLGDEIGYILPPNLLYDLAGYLLVFNSIV